MTDDIETLRRKNARLQVALSEANAAREACAQRAFRLESEVERLREALHQISLCSQNSMSSKEECGRIARAALRQEEAK